MTGYAALQERIGAINDVLNAMSVLQWDQRTMMPSGGVATRAKQIATLVGVARDLLLSDETRRAVDAASREVAEQPEDSAARREVRQTEEAIAFHSRIPAAIQKRRAELKSVANAVWIESRATSNFALFKPYLEQVVDVSRAYADAIGYAAHPYDALMSIYEPGETVASLKTLFAALRAGIRPLIEAARRAPEPRADFLERDFPKGRQQAFGWLLAEKIGFDTKRGRLDETVHPFEISFTRNDVRITTRYYANFLNPSLFGALHEAGHGIYEQNVDPAYTRTTLATDLVGYYAVGGVSFGAHESQSRLYENHIGRSRAFWRLHFGDLRAAFPGTFDDIDAETFYRGVNRVRPGFIRVEADELTYDIHIMLRVEIESGLMDGSLKVADLPEMWNSVIKRDLGLDVPDDRRGVLQDIHWSTCQIGTFCNYTIGNVMAAQLMDTIRRTQPQIMSALEQGDYIPLRTYLTDAVHRHGRRFTRDELLTRATGRALDAAPYVAYLRGKVADVYGVAVG
jgi:carboxypeptidase Taq